MGCLDHAVHIGRHNALIQRILSFGDLDLRFSDTEFEIPQFVSGFTLRLFEFFTRILHIIRKQRSRACLLVICRTGRRRRCLLSGFLVVTVRAICLAAGIRILCAALLISASAAGCPRVAVSALLALAASARLLAGAAALLALTAALALSVSSRSGIIGILLGV